MTSFNVFCEEIKNRLKDNLPGDSARKRMSPSIRMPENGFFEYEQDPIESAVCLLLFPSENKIFFPLIKRAGGIYSHGGQISFPGGKYEARDENLRETAIRETFEEVGIMVPKENILGRLSLLYVPVSNYMIAPYVAYLDIAIPYDISEYEVQFVLNADLSSFFKDDNKFEMNIKRGDIEVVAPYYSLEEERVWGATAMILSEFEALCGDLINK